MGSGRPEDPPQTADPRLFAFRPERPERGRPADPDPAGPGLPVAGLPVAGVVIGQ